MITDRVIAAAGGDHVQAATAVDGVGAGTGDNRVGACRACDRDALGRVQDTGVDILEIGHVNRIAGSLVRVGQIDGHRGLELQRIGADAAVDRSLCTAIGDRVVAVPADDQVGAAGAIDRIVAKAADDGIGQRIADDGNAFRRAQCAGVDVLEVRHRHGIADGLVDTAKIDVGCRRQDQVVDAGSAVDGEFRAVIGHGVTTGAGSDDVSAATAIDDIVARTGGDGVRRSRAGHGQRRRQRATVEVLEVCDSDGVARCLIVAGRDGKVDIGHCGAGDQDETIRTCATIHRCFGAAEGNRIVATTGRNHVGAATAVDQVGAGTTDDGVRAGRADNRDHLRRGQPRGIHVLEIRDGREVAGGLVRRRQVERG